MTVGQIGMPAEKLENLDPRLYYLHGSIVPRILQQGSVFAADVQKDVKILKRWCDIP